MAAKKRGRVVPINTARKEWAEVALKAFAETVGGSLDDDEVEALVKDLLTDLAHFCDQRGLSFYDIVEDAGRYHRDEVREESDVALEML
jgi:hypothetical protein